ncbi:hypothetical protein [Aeromicrobium wangtongii]|uniref:Uncharacterized protein n=1 Tax=Aeromicrobium wangtongii TaxID=2969247 RepID=A0ABY5M6K9_9ACTN|nr:hypothetical protein [Aeromicrobium wangtongii]MCD9198570.1 hypothetical protein [Aeromicrobium wangtongii]UUP12595.1 hypothetical protein NQV15_12100 [Aeromicrobium wangtongii]
MTDGELIEALQAIFAGDGPADAIDRSDGYGERYRIEAVRLVPSDDGFDDLEVTVRFLCRPVWRRRTVVARLLFDRAWREASDLLDPASCAAYVLARWRFSQVRPESLRARRRRRSAEAAVPGIGVCWQQLLGGLRRPGVEVTEDDGLIRLTGAGDDTVQVHVTPQQWRAHLADAPDALSQLHEQIGSRWDDEHHIVFFRGRFHQSIRAELPPVRSMLLREPELPDGFVGYP